MHDTPKTRKGSPPSPFKKIIKEQKAKDATDDRKVNSYGNTEFMCCFGISEMSYYSMAIKVILTTTVNSISYCCLSIVALLQQWIHL